MTSSRTSRLTGMPAFSVIWIGQFVSLIGSSLFRFAIGIWLYQETGLATTFTTMIFFNNIPRIILSPFAGALVDRLNRKLMMMVSDFATGLTTLILFALLQVGSVEIWHIYLLTALSSAFEAFQFPAYSSAITMMVEKKHFARTSAMLALADDGSLVLAPILAASLIGIIGLNGIVLIDMLTFAVAIGTLLIVPIPQPPQSETGKRAKGSLWKEVGYGFRFMLENPSLLGLQVNFLFVNLMQGLSIILRTPMVLARTGNDEIVLGIVASIMAAGGVVGGLVMSIWGGPKRRINGVLGGLIMISVGRAIFGLGQEVMIWSIGGFVVYFFVALSNASNQALWQAKTPADVQGKVFAARRVTGQLTYPIAVLIAGPLSDRLFEPAMMEGGSLASLFGGLVGTGPGAGMSLLIVLTAVIGITVPIASYAIPNLRNVEDIVPDIEAVAADTPTPAEPVEDDSGTQEPAPSPA
ncbi:MAG: MFS transporter [Chloroflexi bacterium]|nr:MFS transporter [Chloroflexota bacterium]